MAREPNTKPCSAVRDDSVRNAGCMTIGTGGYDLCGTHSKEWRRAHKDLKCDYVRPETGKPCTNFLYRPGNPQPVSRSLILDGIKYRRCNEHFAELLFYSIQAENWNIDRFAELIRPGENGCWIFTQPLNGNSRYGGFDPYGSDMKGRRNPWQAHKVAYGLFIGGYSKDHQIDHRCKNGLCVRPDHLQAVTKKENLKRRHKKPMRPYMSHRTEFAIRFAMEHGLPI